MVTAVIAIGQSGQMGLEGKLPWHDPTDLKRFRETTKGGVLVAGWQTYRSMSHLSDHLGQMDNDRVLILEMRTVPVLDQIEQIKALFPNRPVFVIGGAKTLVRWAPYVGRWDISKVDYDGPADTWFNPSLLHTGEQHWEVE